MLEFPSKLKLALLALAGIALAGGVIGLLVLFGVVGGDDGLSDFEAEMAAMPTIDFSAIDEGAAEPADEPTPTPAPTPDIGATQVAVFEATREYQDRLQFGDPLERAEATGHLGEAEKRYLSAAGGGIWQAVVAWVLLREVVYRDTDDWDRDDVALKLDLAGDSLRDAATSLGTLQAVSEGVDRVVVGYVNRLEHSVSRLSEGHQTLVTVHGQLWGEDGQPSDLSVDDRERVGLQVRESRNRLAEFSDQMARYGCSVCGEFFRRVESGGP